MILLSGGQMKVEINKALIRRLCAIVPEFPVVAPGKCNARSVVLNRSWHKPRELAPFKVAERADRPVGANPPPSG